ncbi:Phosphatidylinositol 5-phosphate 4-kinase type-2 gamma [Bagarius yarrelli]|uniref:1-phosphatidylinositol-5-phosphate 4-kinase n=1 Tax=Bagarius yarrelli TaxID=175774 RepID=A0A556V4W9_BAGYA|nr:Phosphatidylinositol 5-phosphate 4-kinase type-2 gamma [Bagarius yarrelli]
MASPKSVSITKSPPSKLRRTKSKKKHFVHQKVEVFRASDPVLSVFMWGINHTVHELHTAHASVLNPTTVNVSGTQPHPAVVAVCRENLPGHFKFKEYCPQVFRNLRERFGIEDQDYQMSLVRSSPMKDSDSQDDLLLSSHDRLLIIKQISSEEVEDMHNVLSEYHQHVVESHGVTLLPQFLGMYRVTVNNEDTYFIIMRNMFSHRLTIHTKYDLKGSLVSREASDKEKEKDLPTFKDMDFRNNMQRIYISDQEKEKLMEKLDRDVDVSQGSHTHTHTHTHSPGEHPTGNLILLLGIHELDRGEREEEEEEESACEEEDEQNNGVSMSTSASPSTSPKGGAASVPAVWAELNPGVDVYGIQSSAAAPRREIYFMGLINILTHYDTKKKAAHAAKTVKHGMKSDNETDWLPDHCTVRLDFASRQIGLFLFHLFLFVVGVILNLTVVWVNWQRRRTRNTVIFCILNMGVADSILMLILPISMLEVALDHVWLWGDFLCRSSNFIMVANIHASSFFLAYISVERYLLLVRGSAPKMGSASEKSKRNIICVALWIFALFLSSLETAHVRILATDEPVCFLVPEHDYEKWFGSLVIIQLSAQFLIPAALMVTFNTLTARAVRSSLEVQSRNNDDVWFLHVYSLVFIICWLPFQINMVLILVDLAEPELFDCNAVEQLFFSYAVVRTVAFLHCLANPILYSFLSRSFRSKLINLVLSHLPQDAVANRGMDQHANRVEGVGNGGKANNIADNNTSQTDGED